MRRRNNRVSSRKNRYLQIIQILLLVIIAITLVIFIQKSNKSTNQNIEPKDSTQISETQQNSNTIQENVVEENKTQENTAQESTIPEDPNKTFTMAITGDIMCHNTMYQDAYDTTTKTYDFSHIFEDIKYHIQIADIAVGNLETTFAGEKIGYSGYPTFNTPETLANNLKKIGFDVLSTANNHCMDKGYSGLESTIKYLDKADIAHTGTYASKESQQEIIVKNVKGVSIAFLSFTYGTNGIKIPSGKEYSVNLIDKDLILEQLKLAKAQGPDLICVSMHWGTEYQTTPNSTQKEWADFLFKNGADIIIGNHPHVLQPMEKRTIKLEDGTTKDGFVVYSLGNFMANQNYKYTQDSAILNLSITKNTETGKITINTATYTPIYMYKDTSKSKKKFKILDIEKTIAAYEADADKSIGKTTYNTLVTELKNIKRILGDEIKK